MATRSLNFSGIVNKTLRLGSAIAIVTSLNYIVGIPKAQAAIFAIGDSGFQDNTLANLGFSMNGVTFGPPPIHDYGDLFTQVMVGDTQIGTIDPAEGLTGNESYGYDAGTTTITFANCPLGVYALAFFTGIDPNVTVTAFTNNGSQVSLTQQGAAENYHVGGGLFGNYVNNYFGFYTTDGDTISSIEIDGIFDYLSAATTPSEAVPEPTTIFGSLVGLGALVRTRRKNKTSGKS